MKHIILLLCLVLCFSGCVAQHVPPDGPIETPAQTKKPLISPTASSSIPEPSPGVTPVSDTPFARIDFDDTVSVDMDFDGTDETISISEGDGIVTVAYTDGDVKKEKLIEPLYVETCFIDDVAENDGYLELFVIGDMASDDYVTYIYRIKDSVLDECAIYGIVGETDGSRSLLVKATIDVFGTYGAQCLYSLKDGFDFAVSSPYTVIQYEGYEERKITVKKYDLSAQASINGGEYENVLLPEGTELLLKETDCKSYGIFTTENNTRIRIAITKNPDEWGWYIDGMPEEEWFDGLSYSG